MDIFTPITNAQCGMPTAPSPNKNAAKGGRRTYRRRGGRRRTPRPSNYHSPKPTRRGRKSRKTSRR